ncbi:MAG: hypothetical protein KatS3mg109_0430 [Pirellulaceae bacterium]|nr:MAG: hypothetical protein KatS3mg109_0430 [Pirellulaceae bacterium]
MNPHDVRKEDTRCKNCGQANKPQADFCDECGMELRPAVQPVPPVDACVGRLVLLARSLSPRDLNRLRSAYEAVQGCVCFPQRILWPEQDEDDSTLWQELPEGTVILSEVRSTIPMGEPSRGWLELVSQVAIAIDQIHRFGYRLNSLGFNSIIVSQDTYEFVGLCLPISLTALDTPREEMTLVGLDCCFASPEVQGYTDHPIGPTADVYALATLTYYLLSGTAPRDLVECNFCPVKEHRALGPSMRRSLEDALAVTPACRPSSALQFVERVRKALVQDLCRPGPGLNSAFLTDIGIGGRDNNEDACGVWIHSAVDSHGSCLVGVAAVADGMGGGAFGERASSLCIDRIVDASASDLRLLGGALAFPADWVTACRDWMLRLNQEVIDLGKQLAAPNNVGSTLSAVLFAGHRAFLLHAGDSRLYLIRSGSICRLTRSQTYAEQLHQEGLLTEEEVDKSSYRHVLTSYIGSPKCAPHVQELHLVPGDRLVLCSDGLVEGLTEQDICHLASSFPPNEAVVEMVRLCKHRLRTTLSALADSESIPYSDNITVVVIQIFGEPRMEDNSGVDATQSLSFEGTAGPLLETAQTRTVEGDMHARSADDNAGTRAS